MLNIAHKVNRKLSAKVNSTKKSSIIRLEDIVRVRDRRGDFEWGLKHMKKELFPKVSNKKILAELAESGCLASLKSKQVMSGMLFISVEKKYKILYYLFQCVKSSKSKTKEKQWFDFLFMDISNEINIKYFGKKIKIYQTKKKLSNKKLTNKENNILRLISEGYCSYEIQKKLRINQVQLIAEKESMRDRLNLKSTDQLAGVGNMLGYLVL